jgi:Beta-propeller repeat
MNTNQTFFWRTVVCAVAVLEVWFAFAPQVHAEGGVPLWTNIYGGPSNNDSAFPAIAADRSGNIFATVSSWNGSNTDLATIKYSAAGFALWTNRYNSGRYGGASPSAMALDSHGNVFVTGGTIGSGGRGAYATVAYSGTGAPLWTNLYEGPGGDSSAHAIAVDSSSRVFITGQSSVDFYGLAYVTVAYSGAGAPLWTNRYNGTNGGDKANAIAADSNGNVFVTGESGSVMDSLAWDYGTVAYSAAGLPLWTNLYGITGSNRSDAIALATDGSGNVFVTGFSADDAGKFEYATVGYSGAGVPLWTNRYHEPGNNAYARAIAVDRSGNVLVTGRSDNGTGDEYVTIKYSNAGLPLWTNRYSGGSYDIPNAVEVDSSGSVFVTGASWNGTNNDFATIGYSGEGVPLWTNRYHGPDSGNAVPSALAVDSSGNVLVTGSSGRNGGGAVYNATIKYSSSIPPVHLAILADDSGGYLIRFNGIPGSAYRMQRATSLTGPWIASAPQTAPASGFLQFHDLFPPPGQAFYRTVQP